jgi:hypothetical protein
MLHELSDVPPDPRESARGRDRVLRSRSAYLCQTKTVESVDDVCRVALRMRRGLPPFATNNHQEMK